MLSPSVKLWLKKGKVSVLGSGRARLLKAIDSSGSIKKAAKIMNMSYRHAWGIIRQIEKSIGESLVETTRGGPHGGGARLTERGKEVVKQFDDTEAEIDKLLRYGPRPSLAVDGVIFDKDDTLVLIRRKYPPFQGQLALPGGFVENYETTDEAVVREVREELGIETKITHLVGVYSAPTRDPRQHTVSVAYHLEPLSTKFKAGDDAMAYEKVPIHELSTLKSMAFDHDKIITDAMKLMQHLKKNKAF